MENIINNDARRKLDRPITGVIHKDKIWEQWYSKEALENPLPKKSQEKYLFDCIGDNENRVIINYKGKQSYTVNQFKAYVEKFKKAFAMCNYQKGDVICTIGLTTPEMYAIKYAATSLGLVTCNLNILDMAKKDKSGANELYNKIKMINPRALFVVDYLEDKVLPVVNDSEFKDILKVSMPLDYCVPKYDIEKNLLALKYAKNKKDGKIMNDSISLEQFLKNGELCQGYDEIYEPGLPCNISFTSGTTGANKAVVISHDANNATAYQQKVADFGYEVGTTNLALLPPFLAFWDADVVHTVLCLGGQNIIDLTVDPEKVKAYFKKYDINMGIWPQSIWTEVLSDKKTVKRMQKSLHQPIIGGERCEINAAETFYNMTGVAQLTGYGASEVNTTFSVCHPNCNKIGSAGLPLPLNNVKIVNDSMEDLTYGQPGKLLIQSPSLMNGYYNEAKLTKEAMYTDEDGQWYRTGDYAVIDDDGCLTVLDRYKKPIVINNNKVQLLDVVEQIKKDRNIRICKLNHIRIHTSNVSDEKIILNIELDNFLGLSTEAAVESIKETIRTTLDKDLWPDYISVFEKLPRTSVGKVDFPKLDTENIDLIKNNPSEEKLTVVYKIEEKSKIKKMER